MNDRQIHVLLDRVAARLRASAVLKRVAFCWLGAALAASLAVAGGVSIGAVGCAAILSATIVAAVCGIMTACRRYDRGFAARLVEQAHPELKQSLLTALEQQPDVATGRFSFLQQRVIDDVLAHNRRVDWRQVAPTRRLAQSAVAHLICFGLFVAASVMLLTTRAGANTSPIAASSSPEIKEELHTRIHALVEPGHVEIERGTSLLVLARFDDAVPPEATLVYVPAETVNRENDEIRVPLTRSLDDPLFGGRIERVNSDGVYRVEFADGAKNARTDEFHVTVFDYPRLERADVAVSFPEYTGLPEAVIEDALRVSAVEGSTVRLTCRFNKPVASARLTSDDDRVVDLAPHEESTPSDVFSATLPVEATSSWTLHLKDDKGRANRFPPEFEIVATPNRRPELKLAFPARDLRVSPLEEVSLEASVWDDFGLKQYGLIYRIGGGEAKTVVLGEAVKGREARDVSHLLELEELSAKPDQLVSYYFFADDHGPDGGTRRTMGDMYFAEVRHFEEIFRQGQQPPGGGGMQGGGGGQAKNAEKLAALQKQIVNATWTLIRRETGEPPGATFATDVKAVHDSQQAAIARLKEIEAKLKDAKSRSFAQAAAEHMTQAAAVLKRSADGNNVEALMEALTFEHSAYEALLKLRAREHSVTQGQSGGGGGGGGGGRSQQQMNQLELKNQQNRYQTNPQAKKQVAGPKREELQVLNRLRELARRQGGLNDKLKEMENLLREAKTEQEREEIQRRLKRLREEQQELLRNLDELRDRMDRPENQRKMTDSRREVEQVRERVRQSSDALKRGRLSQALNSGTRAERKLNQLKDEFRKKTAGRFNDEMRELRDRARQLSENQQDVSKQLDQAGKPERRTLRASGERRKLEERLHRQKADLNDVLDRMKDVVRRAESSEPLLSKQLYDGVRETRKTKPAEHLDAAADLLKRGLPDEAAKVGRQAHRGIEQVRKQIEKAAEGVLGGEAEALKRASKELADASQALRKEIAANSPKSAERAGEKPPLRTASKESSQPGAKNTPSPRAAPRGPSAGKTSKSNQPTSAGNNPEGAKPGSKQPGGKQGEAKAESPGKGATPGQSGSSGKSGSGKGDSGGKGQSPGKGASKPSMLSQGGMSGGPGGQGGRMGPLTGRDFKEWSDRLRDVEEMVEDPKLRAEMSKIRERARTMRAEFKRHSKPPNWTVVRDSVLNPMTELQTRLAEEIARRESPESLVPIDRDPVPERFEEMVREYYERLGDGRGLQE